MVDWLNPTDEDLAIRQAGRNDCADEIEDLQNEVSALEFKIAEAEKKIFTMKLEAAEGLTQLDKARRDRDEAQAKLVDAETSARTWERRARALWDVKYNPDVDGVMCASHDGEYHCPPWNNDCKKVIPIGRCTKCWLELEPDSDNDKIKV